MTDTVTYEEISYPLSEEECLKIGGHCYEMADYSYDTNPPIYVRICKHCGHKQEGMRLPDYDWSDVSPSTK